MQIRGIKGVFTAAIALAVFSLGGTTAKADTWRVATLAPSGSAWMKMLAKGAAEIKTKTDGRIGIKYYADGVQGDETVVVKKMLKGALDGAALTTVGLSQIVPSIRVLELPRLFDSVKEMEYVRLRMWKHFQRKFLKKGYILGIPGDVGWIQFMSKNNIRNLAELRKQKLWMWGSDKIVRAMYKELGLKGVSMGVPQVLTALTTGKINGCYGSPLVATALQWYSKVKYMSKLRMSYAIGASIIRADVYNKATPEDQKTQKLLTLKYAKKLKRFVRRDNSRSITQMKRKGVRFVDAPIEMEEAFDKAAQAVWKKLTGKLYSKWQLDTVLKLRQKYRDKQAKK
jgi:TRAP-type C4-dicarboxylate transport system substrate-binding protein